MLAVGYGNGIYFRPENGRLPSFDNTLVENEDFWNRIIYKVFYLQYFKTDLLTIQVRVGHGDGCTLRYYRNDGTSALVTGTLPPNLALASGDFWRFDVDFSLHDGQIMYFITTNSTTGETWRSEPVEVVDPETDSLLFEWYGNDAQFGCHYQGDIPVGKQQYQPFFRLPAILKNYEPKEEITVYGNQDEAVKLYHKITRTLELKTDALPRYMLEKLVVASAHDYFFINEVEFIREEKADTDNFDGANTGELKFILMQKNVLGLNTHDIGFDCEEIIMASCKVNNMQEYGVGANTSFTIPVNHGLDIITVWYVGGSDVLIKFGTTPGGDEIGKSRPAAGVPDVNRTLNTPQDLTKSGTATLYVTVTGSSVNVDIFVRTIQNRDV